MVLAGLSLTVWLQLKGIDAGDWQAKAATIESTIPTSTDSARTPMATIQRISPCLWFDDKAEEAARFYTGIFKNSRIKTITRYGKAGFETHHRPAGSVMVVAFELDGQSFSALNGGPLFKFNEAISLQVNCATQDEIDYYWEKLSAGGDPKAQQCGWLKDRYGLSWQVVPNNMNEFFADEKSAGAQRAMEAMLPMRKLDIAALKRAHDGAK
jgi:predicted 3-demethylubiquinone-9 3-methyltransferase (glyoxalase superfamily)